MKCQSCGNEVKESAKFCRNCGSEVPLRNRCPECGAPLGKNAAFCKNCGASVHIGTADVKNITHRKKSKLWIALVIVTVAALVGGFAAGYMYQISNEDERETKKSDTVIKESDDTESKVKDFEPYEDENFENNAQVSEEADYDDETWHRQESETFHVEEEVLKIRELYNATQSSLRNLSKKTDENGITKYFDGKNNLLRADIPSDSVTLYTKYYYFNDGEIYFAFVFDGRKENRLYFKNGELFRWIDEEGEIHDYELNNASFKLWEKEVTDDVHNKIK